MSGDSPEAIKVLVAAGANIDVAATDGRTPLHIAARYRNYRARLETLINDGATVNATDRDGNTPLHVAARHNRQSAMLRLIVADADVNAHGISGFLDQSQRCARPADLSTVLGSLRALFGDDALLHQLGNQVGDRGRR